MFIVFTDISGILLVHTVPEGQESNKDDYATIAIMLPFVLMFAVAMASGPPVETDPADCLSSSGYLAGTDFGEDCCSFVVCDAARLNKTGFVGKCMGGTAWNQDLLVCDDPKYVDCDVLTCDVPSRTNAECDDPQPTGSTCCVGQNRENGKNGYEPVFSAGSDESSYFRGDDREEQTCPFGQIFSLESCCCEYVYEVDPACADTTSFFFDDPTGDGCCSYIQCFANRTGYDVYACLGGSVWNSANKTCDIPYNVMDCMSALCGDATTDPPCDGTGSGTCCRAGNYYIEGGDDTQYIITDGPGASDRLQCCPQDMDGLQLIFNFDEEEVIMLPFVLMFAVAMASGPPVETDPEACKATSGYLAGTDFGEDCCSFVVCDAARLNKTGFVGKCMGGTAWNQDLLVCDDPKYVDCDVTTCDVPSRTTAECAEAQPTGSTCCVGQNRENGKNGYEPVFSAGSDESSYFRGDDREEQTCPFGQIFNLESCCCEYVYEVDPACADTTSFFFDDPTGDGCCSYIQCFANRTGYSVYDCLGGSVWNSANKTCDIPYNVMDCMSALCGDATTDPPCDGTGSGACCRAGNYYDEAGDATQYFITDGPGASDRLQCCPQDMDGLQLIFNFDEEQLRNISTDLGLNLTDDQLEQHKEHMKGVQGAYQMLEELVEPTLEVKFPRTPGHKPKPDENPFNAWAWCTDIKGSENGKLKGKTVAMKDSIAVAGVPMTNGSKTFEGYVPEFDATVVTRILEAGGRIMGKSVCEDLCHSCNGFTAISGPVTNPLDSARTPGGSSSGSAALVAGGIVNLALGGDQGGSIRIPASLCGIVGLKPTHGLVPYSGAVSVDPSFDHLGPITRTVDDCALLLEVLAGYDGFDPRQKITDIPDYTKLIDGGVKGMNIGFVEEGFAVCESDVVKVVKETADVWKKAGFAIWTPIFVEGVYMHGFVGANVGNKGFYPNSMLEHYKKHIKVRPYDLPPTVQSSCLWGEYTKRNYQSKHYGKGHNLNIALTAAYDKALEAHDVIVMPTTPCKAPKLPSADVNIPEVLKETSFMLINTAPFNITGHPAISVNAGFSEGLPIGVMIVGRRNDDVTVLRVAKALESSLTY
ncbi:unnamed protein product [Owenia fusiformis]|uniref:Chitin-binding type-2 domain-containing protein n=1 Tax=Owenia fusiformis TaxID=6347 RepID=A0A8S4NJH3_OWEFU|nr:unnamed protein product [Owenia fusiformis]